VVQILEPAELPGGFEAVIPAIKLSWQRFEPGPNGVDVTRRGK
jgi:hypothetical protein